MNDIHRTADQCSYLGDGVYVEFVRERGMLKLETRDGISATNTIWLEGAVYQALEDFVHALCEAEVDRGEAEEDQDPYEAAGESPFGLPGGGRSL